MESAEFVIALVNKQMPRTFGDALVHISMINIFVEDDTPLLTVDMLDEAAFKRFGPHFHYLWNNIVWLMNYGLHDYF